MTSENSYNGFANDLQASLPQLLDSGKHSDLTITCESDTPQVHKVFMCAHSTYFTKACEGEFQEAKSGEVRLEGDDPVVVKAMIEAIYRGDYSHGDKDVPSASLQFHAKVYALGDKYDVPSLRRLAQKMFLLGCKNANPQLMAIAIEEIYSSTPSSDRGLRDIAVKAAVSNSTVLWEDSEFNSIIERVGEFGRDLAKSLCNDKKDITCTRCYERFCIITEHPTYITCPARNYGC